MLLKEKHGLALCIVSQSLNRNSKQHSVMTTAETESMTSICLRGFIFVKICLWIQLSGAALHAPQFCANPLNIKPRMKHPPVRKQETRRTRLFLLATLYHFNFKSDLCNRPIRCGHFLAAQSVVIFLCLKCTLNNCYFIVN